MPRVVLARRARKGLDGAPARARQAIDDAIDALERGAVTGERLRGGLSTLFRIRVDDWRILYEHRPDGALRILRIAHRSDAYRSDPR